MSNGMSDVILNDITPQPLRRNIDPAPTLPRKRKLDGEIRWAPVNFSRRLPMTGTAFNAVRDALVKVFGEFPITLTYKPEENLEHAQMLKAMAAACGDAGEPFAELHTVLLKYHGVLLTEK